MSSLDSGVNSITAVVMTDFVGRFRKQTLSEKARLRVARGMALGIGSTVVVASSFVVEHIPGNFLEMTKRTIGLFVTPLFTLFFLALFVRFATQAGAILGGIAGFLSAVLVAYWQPLTGLPMISFQWIFPVSLFVGVVTGCLASIVTASRRDGPPAAA